LIVQLLNIIISPSVGWLKVKGLGIKTYLILFILVAPVLLFCGLLYAYGLFLRNAIWSQIVLQLTFIILWGTATIFLTSMVLSRLTKMMGGQCNFNQAFLVSSVSFSIFFILWSLPVLSIVLALPFKIISLYSLVVLYKGASIVLSVPNIKLVGFTMLSAIILILCVTITGVLLSAIFQQPISF
jgi:hypothetical protein